MLHGARLRQRGPAPRLADSEVLAMEVAGEFLGQETDRGIYRYFRRHWPALFPRLAAVHRTTLLRQAANLWAVKRALWQRLLPHVRGDRQLSIVDSVPVPVRRFARAKQCRLYPGVAAYGRAPWHLCSRWLRKVLSHTTAVLLCQEHGLGSLAFSHLVAG